MIASKPYERVLGSHEMPGTRWFEGAELNYAENLLSGHDDERDRGPALLGAARAGGAELGRAARAGRRGRRRPARRSASGRGDRVVAYMPNIPETLIAFLATASLGAIWSSAAPEFGARRVIDRFAQIEPKVFLSGRRLPPRRQGLRPPRRRRRDPRRAADASSTRCCCPTSTRAPSPGAARRGRDRLGAAAGRGSRRRAAELRAGPVRPPAVGALLLRHDRPAEGDRAGPRRHPARAAQEAAAPRPARRRPHVLVHDDRLDDVELPRRLPAQRGGDRALRRQPRAPGSRRALAARRARPDHVHGRQRRAARDRARRRGIEPARRSRPEQRCAPLGSTGSPLSPESFRWVYEHVDPDIWLFSTSGGTDVCTAFVAGCPMLPVYEGELQCRALGCKVESWDEAGPLARSTRSASSSSPSRCPRCRCSLGRRERRAPARQLLRDVPRDLAPRRLDPHHARAAAP